MHWHSSELAPCVFTRLSMRPTVFVTQRHRIDSGKIHISCGNAFAFRVSRYPPATRRVIRYSIDMSEARKFRCNKDQLRNDTTFPAAAETMDKLKVRDPTQIAIIGSD